MYISGILNFMCLFGCQTYNAIIVSKYVWFKTIDVGDYFYNQYQCCQLSLMIINHNSNTSKKNIVLVFNHRILLVRKGLIKGQDICNSIKYP